MSVAHVSESTEEIVHRDGRDYYRIAGFNRLKPFFMALVSDGDLWMYLSSSAGLTAGRGNENHCLFPYETDDKIHRSGGITGPITLVRVSRTDLPETLWRPLFGPAAADVQRNLYKTALSDAIIFEEINPSLGLAFSYQWQPSAQFGFVRSCKLVALPDAAAADVAVLDGVVNLLPYGPELAVQQQFSCLINAYTQIEVDAASGLGIFAMTSRLSDKAEPAESLRANIAWHLHDAGGGAVYVDPAVVDAFVLGENAAPQAIFTGRRGAYLLQLVKQVTPHVALQWQIVLDAGKDQFAIAALQQKLVDQSRLAARLSADVAESSAGLLALVARADGLQCTADTRAAAHHAANVLFNNMRGGVFAGNYRIDTADFIRLVAQRNMPARQTHAVALAALPAVVGYRELLHWAEQSASPDLYRLAHEYLPLTFSRRHGDPSRPWNRFDIRVRNADGSPILDYQGNWRDIFQNWEALAASFPLFAQGMIAKFVNAGTPDGFNPYRLSHAGIDWEIPNPDHPWANIGYWGDHQIIYLLKLLELTNQHDGRVLRQMLGRAAFSYANVPYRLKPYAQLLAHPHDTIEFDWAAQKQVTERARQIGADGKLLLNPDGTVYHTTLAEKLLIPALSKLCNLVADAGIWMNTQRPEWNDGNNALVGAGVSAVTLAYLRRYLAFCIELFAQPDQPSAPISIEIADWLVAVEAVLKKFDTPGSTSDTTRRQLLDALGGVFDDYRTRVYRAGFSGKRLVDFPAIVAFLKLALRHVDRSLNANRRDDGLYHAYSVLELKNDPLRASVHQLYQMLEGQVAVLSSGVLSPAQALQVIDGLFASPMYRPDQKSFMLYPARTLPNLMGRNIVPRDLAVANPLLSALLAKRDCSIIAQDAGGKYRFHCDFRQASDLAKALDALAAHEDWRELIIRHRQDVLDIYEKITNHREFTGRSGIMFGYEGIGCIYWHQVAKLLLAVQECYWQAVRAQLPAAVVGQLAAAYYRVRQGLGFNKSAQEYGAFPLDPYSHTPRHAGAQQPGMTGQVKEEILTRLGELGIRVAGGQIEFQPLLLRRREFFTKPTRWSYVDLDGKPANIDLPAHALGFTYCQVPVVYQLGGVSWRISVQMKDGSEQTVESAKLDADVSAQIFNRSGAVRQLWIAMPEGVVSLE